MRYRITNQGQSTIEFALLIAVVVAAFVAMQVFLKRGLEGNLKQSGERFGSQWDAAQGNYTVTTTNDGTRHEVLNTAGQTQTDITGDEHQNRLINNEHINASNQLFDH